MASGHHGYETWCWPGNLDLAIPRRGLGHSVQLNACILAAYLDRREVLCLTDWQPTIMLRLLLLPEPRRLAANFKMRLRSPRQEC